MTRGGHFIAGTALAVPLASLGHYVLAASVILGSNLPDQLEFTKRNHSTGQVFRLIPHRTITHYPWLWLGMGVILYFMNHQIMNMELINPYYFNNEIMNNENINNIILTALFGLIIGALGHILVDMCSPTGVPLVTPFGKRTSVYLYTTGRGEWKLLIPLSCASIIFTTHHLTTLGVGLWQV